MTIRFPPEQRQPPPHYQHGPRVVAQPGTPAATVRAIVHPEAIRLARPRPAAPLSAASPVAPHVIAFSDRRPPPGTHAVDAIPSRGPVRAIVHPDARIPQRARFIERVATEPAAPHTIVLGSPLPPPRYRDE